MPKPKSIYIKGAEIVEDKKGNISIKVGDEEMEIEKKFTPKAAANGKYIQCQGTTQHKKRCEKHATYSLDLTKNRQLSVLGWSVTIPVSMIGLSCCFYCGQHAVTFATEKGLQLLNFATENLMSNDEYAAFLANQPHSPKYINEDQAY